MYRVTHMTATEKCVTAVLGGPVSSPSLWLWCGSLGQRVKLWGMCPPQLWPHRFQFSQKSYKCSHFGSHETQQGIIFGMSLTQGAASHVAHGGPWVTPLFTWGCTACFSRPFTLSASSFSFSSSLPLPRLSSMFATAWQDGEIPATGREKADVLRHSTS